MLIVSQLTRQATACCARFDAYMAQGVPDPPQVVVRPVLSLAPVPPDRTASHHWGRLVNDGLLGALYLTVLPAAAYLNSLIMAEAFEILFDRMARTVAEIPVTLPVLGPVVLAPSDFWLYGAALTLAQILMGASLGEDFERPGWMKWFVLFLAIVPFVTFICWTNAGRGYLISLEEHARLSPLQNALLSALQAYCLAVVDLLAGRWVIHEFLLPLVRGGCWAAVTPPRALRRWWELRRLNRKREWETVLVADVRAPREPGRFARVGSILDELFVPLRTVDEAVARLLRGLGAIVTRTIRR